MVPCHSLEFSNVSCQWLVSTSEYLEVRCSNSKPLLLWSCSEICKCLLMNEFVELFCSFWKTYLWITSVILMPGFTNKLANALWKKGILVLGMLGLVSHLSPTSWFWHGHLTKCRFHYKWFCEELSHLINAETGKMRPVGVSLIPSWVVNAVFFL